MRYLFSSVAALIVSSLTFGQGAAQNLSVTNYQFVSQAPVTATQWKVTYKADLVNTGGPLASVTANATSLNPFSFRTISGEDFLNFAPVPANSQVTSSNTFTILVDRTVNFTFNNLQWSFTSTPVNPVANAGPNQTAPVGSTVTLNGSASTNPSGVGTLTYAWAFTSRPSGSSTTIANRNSVMASFVVDVPGTYIIQLTVNNGVGSSTASVTISTSHTPPVANAGPNETVTIGSTVLLNGSGSTDVDGNPITYAWTITQSPAGSSAILANANTVAPSFVADKLGMYIVELIVSDGVSSSTPAFVTITSTIVPPVANAGPNQVISKGATVQLNGSGSTDVNGLPLSYSWSLITLPAGSGAVLSNPNIVNPTFVADVQGTYVAQLIVTAGNVSSAPSTVTISSNTIQPPVVSAGSPQAVVDGTVVTLHGTASDPQGLPLTLQWSILMKPAGSTATLTNATSLTPTFIADLGGMYVVQLIANNGFLSSAPSTVMITTSTVAPIANAGPNQGVTPGATVTLDGSGSSDSNHDPLSYSWKLLSAPAGSSASLSGATTVSPTFVADLAGAYVVQLIVFDGFEFSQPATVMITATTTPIITLSPNPLAVSNAGGATGTLTVTLSSPAGPNGQIIHLISNDPTIASVPASVFVGAANLSVQVAVTPGNIGSTFITAAAQGFVPATATVNVITPAITLSLSSTTVGLTKTINGTFTLNAPAPPAGVTVNLGSTPAGAIDVEPPSVKVTAGNTTGSFTVTGLAVGPATITAGSPGYTTVSIGVNVSNLGQIILPASATVGTNLTVPLQLSLSTPAGNGGLTVALQSSDTSKVTVPASVFIAQGATAPATLPVATGINFGSATITASSSGLISATETITVSDTLSFSPANLTVATGATSNLNLVLSSPAPAGLVINLKSDNTSFATVPASINFPVNTTSVNVPVTGAAIGTTTIHASSTNLADTTASVTVASLGALNVPASLSVGISQSVAFPVTLSQAAPAAVTVTLGTNSANATISPTTVIIPVGQTAPATQPQVTGVNFGTVTVTASASGYASGTSQVTVTASLSFAAQMASIATGAVQNLVLNISPAAPPSGVVVNLSSNNPAVASVPTTVTIPGNATSVNVPVTGVAQGQATIHASSLPNLADTTTSVTVTPPLGSINLPSGLIISPGSAPFPVTLSVPAPNGGLTVTLQSGTPSVATISPASVFITGGQTAPSTQPQVTGIAFGSSVITASGPGFSTGNQTLKVTGSMAFTPPTLALSGTAPQTLTLTLSGPAPSGGIIINLSSSNTGAATVPATVSVAAGATSIQVPVSGVATGSATIHASSLPLLPDTTAAVTVTITRDISLPANVTVAPGSTIPYIVTLTNPAASNVIVTVTSANPAIASLSTGNVLIPQGQTTGTLHLNGNAFGTTTMTATAFNLTGDTETVNVSDILTYTPTPLAIQGTATQNVTLSLSAQAPSTGLTLNVKSDDPTVASVPSTVTFAPNATTAILAVTGVTTTGGSTTIHASNPPTVLDTTVTVTVAPPGMIVLPSNVTLAPSQTTAFPVTLGTPAPQGGVSVMLTSSDTTVVTISPASVTINAGQTQPAVQPQVTAVNLGNVTIKAVATGYVSASQPVKVAATINFVPNSVNIIGTATTSLQLNLSAPAPASLVINLSSSPAGIVTTPASVTFATGATSVNIPVTGAATGETTITASTTVANIASTTANITVAAPTPATITINGGASQSTAVGTAFATPLAVTVKDGSSNVVPNFPVTFTVVPGASGQSGTFSNNTGTITVNTNASGVATAGVFTANGKSSPVAYTVSVTSGPAPAATFTLTNTPGAATHFSVTAPSPVAGGVQFTIGVTALDSFGNTATSYAGTIHFTSTDGNATLPGNSTLASGVGTFPVTLNTGPTQTITATDTVNASITGVSNTITISAGAATHLSVTGTPGNIAAGTQFTVTVTALNSSNQTATGYTGTVHLTSTDAKAILPGAMTLTNGVGVFNVTLGSVGNQTVSATDNSISGTSGQIAVGPGPAANFVVTAPGTAAPGIAFSITVTARDQFSNTATGYTGTVHFTSSDGAANLPANATLTSGTGTFSVTLNTGGGSQTVTATDTTNAAITGVSAPIAVSNPATHFSVSAPASAAAGSPINVTVTALDHNNALVPSYSGTVHFSSNDPNATLPANTTLTNGTKTVSATLLKVETNTTITATDTVNASITGTSAAINVTGIPAVSVSSGSPQSTQINQAFSVPLVALVTDAMGNPVSGVFVSFTIVPGASGASATFNGTTTTQNYMTNASGLATVTASVIANGTKGAFTVTAAANNFTTATFNLTNTNIIIVGSATVGENLESTFVVTLPSTSASTVCVALTSSDPSRLFVYGGGTAPPAASSFIVIQAGNTQGIAFAEGQGGGTGAVTVTGTLNSTFTPGVGSNPGTCTNPITSVDIGTNTVNVTNSGFVLSQQSGNGFGASFNATLGEPATLVVNSAQLDASGNFVAIQAVHTSFTNNGGTITQNPITVNLANTTPSTGTVPASVTFNGGDTSQSATFNPIAVGSTTVTATSPGNGFTATPMVGCPASCMPANSVFINVPQPTATMQNVSVGNNLQAPETVSLGGIVPGNPNDPNAGINITVSTTDARLSFSVTAGGPASSSIQVFAHAGQAASNTFYVNGLAATGSASFMAVAPNGFGTATATANFTSSSIVIAGPSTHPGAGIFTTPTSGPQAVYLLSEQVDGSGNFISFQPVAASLSVAVVKTVQGTFSSPVVIAAGTSATTTSFTPTVVSNGALAVTQPSGFISPQVGASISVNVATPGITCTGAATLGGAVAVGSNLEIQGSCAIGEPPPPGGVPVTLTAGAGLLLSTSATTVGSSTLQVTVGADGMSTSFAFFLQAVGTAVGTSPSYTATSPGFNSGGGSILVSSQLPYVGGPNAFTQSAGFQITVPNGTSQPLTLYNALVDNTGKPLSHQAAAPLAGGPTTVTVLNSNTVAGTVTPANPVTDTAGLDGIPLSFNAAAGEQGQSTTITAQGGVSSLYGTLIKVN